MTVEIRRGTDRFVDRAAGTAHAARVLVRILVRPGARLVRPDGLPRRAPAARRARGSRRTPHSDLVIVSWVRLRRRSTHTDSTGASATLGPGDVGVLRTGAVGRAQRGRGRAADPVRPGLADRPVAGWRPSYEVLAAQSAESPADPGRDLLGRPARGRPDLLHARRARGSTSSWPAVRCCGRRWPSRCTTATRSCSPTSRPYDLTAGVADRAARAGPSTSRRLVRR